MGIYDRDYYRSPPPRGGFANFQLWSITTWLIVINVAVFFIDRILGGGEGFGPISLLGYFSVDTALYHGQVWRFITFQFLHANVPHLFWNMLTLYFFGPMIEDYLGPRRYLAFYLICGCAGGVSEIILSMAHILGDSPITPLVGASAGIFGVLIAAATVAPNVEIVLLFPPIPIKLKVLAWVMFGISVYTVMSNGVNAGGEAAHIGGALAGFGLIKNVPLLNIFVPSRKSTKRRVAFKDWRHDPNH
jgi:membrane associated rhomboid family serine protease